MIVFVNQMLLMRAGDVERNPGPGKRCNNSWIMISIHPCSYVRLCTCNQLYFPTTIPNLYTDTLSTDDLATLQNALYEVRDEWFTLGVHLKVETHDLRAIRAQCSNNLGECLLEMLSCWLTNTIPTPTWQTLLDALCCTAVGKPQVADKIRKEYLGNLLITPFVCNYIYMYMYLRSPGHGGSCRVNAYHMFI